MDTINTMRAFVAVAQEGSFTAAARRLDISTKLVSKYVAQLEARLAVQLFHRTTRNVTLTDVGSAYLQRCRPLLDQFDELESVVQERQTALAGPIRMTASTLFGSTRLVTALYPFMAANPAVSIDLRLSDNRVALVEEGFDLAIRIGGLHDSTLIARRLSAMPLTVCASPAYLAAHGRPAHPDALATHNCLIDGNRSNPTVWQFHRQGRESSVRVSGSFHANAPGAIAGMAIGGLGIASCPHYTVEAALEDGRLEQLLSDYQTLDLGLHAVYPPTRHLTARVRALIDHLAGQFSPRSA